MIKPPLSRWFLLYVKYSIDNNYPVICHVQTSELPIYEGRVSGHYVVATGYFTLIGSPNGTYDEQTIYYNDPHYDSGYYGAHTCSFSEMTRAINQKAGYYIMGA